MTWCIHSVRLDDVIWLIWSSRGIPLWEASLFHICIQRLSLLCWILASPHEMSLLPLRGRSSTRISSTFQYSLLSAATESYLIVGIVEERLSITYDCEITMMHCQQALYSQRSSTKWCDGVLQRFGRDCVQVRLSKIHLLILHVIKKKQLSPSLILGISHPKVFFSARCKEQQNQGRRSDAISGISPSTRYPSSSVFDSVIGFSSLRLVQFRRRGCADFSWVLSGLCNLQCLLPSTFNVSKPQILGGSLHSICT